MSNSEFFIIPEGAKTVAGLIEADEDGRYWLELSEKKQVSHDTICLTFKFPSADWIFGS